MAGLVGWGEVTGWALASLTDEAGRQLRRFRLTLFGLLPASCARDRRPGSV